MDIQQRVTWLSQHPQIADIWHYLDEVAADIIDSAILIQQIPGPTFHELVRANHVLSRLGACELADTSIDALYNAYGRLKGTDSAAPALLVSAHTDTVFEENTDLAIQRKANGRLYGPGIGDNSMGVAGIIALADIMRHFRIRPQSDIWFLANTREEGLGDLGGIRAFYDTHQSKLGQAVVVEGMALGRIYHAGIAVRRLHVTCHADGGHSWQHFGRPSAIHSLLKLGADIVQLTPPASPRTTYNIGILEGGQSVNSLASDAGFYLDMRSEDPAALATLEQQTMAKINQARTENGVTYQIEVVGDRPAGHLPTDHPLTRGASAALQAVNLPPIFETGSTDANLLLAKGLPTVTVGLTTGGNAHRLDEYIDTAPLVSGMRQFILLVLAAAGWEPSAA
jgi:tripeptide aminopeptidase